MAQPLAREASLAQLLAQLLDVAESAYDEVCKNGPEAAENMLPVLAAAWRDIEAYAIKQGFRKEPQ